MEVADFISFKAEKWEDFYKRSIGMQLVRAADSIAANIAEGYGRYSYKENKTFCYYARGSLMETKTHVDLANRRGLIMGDDYKKLQKQLDDLHRSLNAYIKSIGSIDPTKGLEPRPGFSVQGCPKCPMSNVQ